MRRSLGWLPREWEISTLGILYLILISGGRRLALFIYFASDKKRFCICTFSYLVLYDTTNIRHGEGIDRMMEALLVVYPLGWPKRRGRDCPHVCTYNEEREDKNPAVLAYLRRPTCYRINQFDDRHAIYEHSSIFGSLRALGNITLHSAEGISHKKQSQSLVNPKHDHDRMRKGCSSKGREDGTDTR